MKLRRMHIMATVGVTALTLSVLPAVRAQADGGSNVFWDGTGTASQGWQQEPAYGVWTNAPVVSANNAYIYTFELACTVESNNLDVGCRNQLATCSSAENGRLVQWSASLRELNPPQFQPVGGLSCVYDTKPRDILEEIAARIEQDFKNSNIAPATVTSQPGPNTLRGAETNFYADAKEQAFDIELLGQRVHINATPTEYTWSYGDGTTVGPTPYPGAPLPEARWGEKTTTSHVYTQTGDYPVTVATHFRGTYSVNGGPPLPIPGQGTFTSAPVQLRVWRSETKNYADNCNQNPQGDGCPGVPAKP